VRLPPFNRRRNSIVGWDGGLSAAIEAGPGEYSFSQRVKVVAGGAASWKERRWWPLLVPAYERCWGGAPGTREEGKRRELLAVAFLGIYAHEILPRQSRAVSTKHQFISGRSSYYWIGIQLKFEEFIMSNYIHDTVPTNYVDAKGIRFAYRRFGNAGGVPLVFNQHLMGTMDYWDPEVTDGLAKNREVILYDYAGVGGSSGETPASVPEMAADGIAFIKALGLSQVDILGYSMGGMVAQEIALQGRDLVRRFILVGTGPRGADMSASKAGEIFAGSYDPPDHLWLSVHFSPSADGRAAGLAFLERKLRRTLREPEVSAKAAAAQWEAVGKYIAKSDGVLNYLKDIRQPALVLEGSHDVIIPTVNSYVLQQSLPNAQLILYSDSNHGSFYQYPEISVRHIAMFLDE
jgi:pimeloyl-ACP methyl ester carboxylesterase